MRAIDAALDAACFLIARAVTARASRFMCDHMDSHDPELIHQGEDSILIACTRPSCCWVADLPLESVSGG